MDTSAFRPRGGRKEARERRSRSRNPEGAMTLVEHLYELRYRLGWAVLALVIGAIVGCLWFRYTIWPIPSLGEIVLYPYSTLPKSQLFGGNRQLLQTRPFEGFMILLKVGVTGGALLSSPAWLYQIWAFITPGLHRKERKLGVAFVLAGSLLFVVGAVIAYLVLPQALRLLTGVAGSSLTTALTANDYVSFLINLLVIFGVSFELPLLIVMLNLVGVLKYERLKHWRRGIIFGLFVFASFATPGSDPFSMIALAGALTVLFEIAVQIARVHDKRVARREREQGWAIDDPDVAGELDHTPEPVGVPTESAAAAAGQAQQQQPEPEPRQPRPSPSPRPRPEPGNRYDDDAT